VVTEKEIISIKRKLYIEDFIQFSKSFSLTNDALKWAKEVAHTQSRRVTGKPNWCLPSAEYAFELTGRFFRLLQLNNCQLQP
jgi:hypothetical protein